MFNNLFELALFCFGCYLCLYLLVDRICKCFEQCALSRSYGEFVKNGGTIPARKGGSEGGEER